MKKLYCTFSGKAYDSTTKLIVERARDFGADDVLVLDDRWLMGKAFYRNHKWLWEYMPLPDHTAPVKFGFGWCSWKAYVIQTAMKTLDPGDIVLYTDADTYPISSLLPLYELANFESITLFEEQGCVNQIWTKRDCFVAMGCDVPECRDRIQCCGRFQLFKKDQPGLSMVDRFLAAWSTFSTDARCQLWDRSKQHLDYPNFRRHSCEQSVLTNLAYLYNIWPHRTPDQNGSGPKDAYLYPQVFFQQYCHGDRDDVSGSSYRNVPEGL